MTPAPRPPYADEEAAAVAPLIEAMRHISVLDHGAVIAAADNFLAEKKRWKEKRIADFPEWEARYAKEIEDWLEGKL